MRVLTWNTGLFNLPRLPTWTPDRSLPGVAARLRALDLDVAFLQEIRLPHQPQRLLQLLGPGWRAAYTEMPGSDRQILALTRSPAPRFGPIDTGTTRHALHMHLPHPASGPGLHLLACHACAYSPQRRADYLLSLDDQAQRLPARDCVVMLGDFNLDPRWPLHPQDRRALRALRQRWSNAVQPRRRTFLKLLQLDHIWLRRQGATQALVTDLGGAFGQGRDHSALLLELPALAATPPRGRARS